MAYYKNQFKSAIGVLGFVAALGWLVIVLGAVNLVLSFAVFDNTSMKFAGFAVSIAFAVNGLVIVAFGQAGQAVISIANTNAEILHLMKSDTGVHEERPSTTSISELETGEDSRVVKFHCPFCEEGLYEFGRCPGCGNTVDQMVLNSQKK